MTPFKFSECNTLFGPPKGFEESQIGKIYACRGKSREGNLDGADFTVVAWQPSEEELARIKEGGPIFLTILWDTLPPHFLSASFEDAVNF